MQKLSPLYLGLILLFSPFVGHAQSNNGQQLLDNAISTWQILRDNIKINSVTNNESAGIRTLGGNATIFGHTCGLAVSFKGKEEITRIALEFPKIAQITTEHFRKLIGKDMNQVFPQGFGSSIGIKSLIVDLKSKKIDGAIVEFTFGTWAPFGNSSTVKLSEIEAQFGIMNIQSRKEFVVGMKSYIYLPKDMTEDFGFGATKFNINGYVNSKTKKLAMGFALSSDYIPLVADRSIVMKGAKFEFYVENSKPGMALGGQVEIRAKGQQPIPLNGEMTIDITGKVFGAAWMDQKAQIRNPFGLSDKVYITQAGLGFGVDFKTTPIPAPSIAMEGGIAIKNSPQGAVIFGGEATVGIDLTEPSKTMIDAKVTNLTLRDFIDAFSRQKVKSEFVKTLRKINFNTLHFTIVPPSAGSVSIFGRTYEPGIYAEGVFTYENFTGAMFIDIKEGKVEAFGGMSPIRHTGFEFTGAYGSGGPYIFLSMNANEQKLSLAANGQLKVLGGPESLTDIYFSDAGFNAVVKTKLFDLYSAELDIAGTDLTKGGSIFVKATMNQQDNLVAYISKQASKEIDKMANGFAKDIDNAKADLEKYRPQLNAKREEVRKEYQAQCNKLNVKKQQDQKRATLHTRIRNLKSEITRMESQLAKDQYRTAKPIKSTTCSGNSRRFGDYCYTCPSGFSWNDPVALNNSKGCIRKAQSVFSKASDKGAVKKATLSDPFPKPCASGQFQSVKTGRCYSCPPGYRQVITADENSSRKCEKVIPAGYAKPNQGVSVKCTGRSKEIKVGIGAGKCWECPSGYQLTVFPVNGSQACELSSMGNRQAAIRNKRVALANAEKDLTALGAATIVTGISSDVCSKVSNSAAIDLDPRVAPLVALVDGAQAILDAGGTIGTGSLRGASWIVEHGGSALGIVEVHKTSFESCLSAVQNGKISMKIEGDYAGQPFKGAFDVNIQSPDEGIRQLAKQLSLTSSPKSLKSNGNCRRPNVPRPQVDGKIKEMLSLVNQKMNNKLKEAPKTEARPSWCGNQQFKDNHVDPTKFKVSDPNRKTFFQNNGGNNSGEGTSTNGDNSSNNSIKTPNGLIKANTVEINTHDAIPFYVNGKTYLYMHGSSRKNGNIYQMQADGTFGDFKAAHKEPSSINNSRELVIPYHVNGINAILFYGRATGSALKIQLAADGTIDKKKISYLDNGSWGKSWHSIASYNIGSKSFVLFYQKSSGLLDIYSPSQKTFEVLHPRLGSFNLGTNIDIANVYEAGGKAFFYSYNRSTGNFYIYPLTNTGQITSSTGSYNLGAGWDWALPYKVGSKNFVYLFDNDTGNSKCYPLTASGTATGQTYFSKGWTKGWDFISPYSVGNKAFVLYYKKQTGYGEVWELLSNGKFGSRKQIIRGGKVQGQ